MRTKCRFLLAALALAVAGCGGRAGRNVEKLLADLMSESPRTRARAERYLAEHGRAIITALSSILTGEDYEEIKKEQEIEQDRKALRVPAARALGLMGKGASLARSEAERAAEPLIKVLGSDDRALRIEAAKALGYFTQLSAPANDLIVLLREDDQELVDAATASLARNALQSVYRIVLREEPPAAAAEKDWGRLMERINTTDDDIRLDTVRELAASRDPRAPPLLLDRLAKDTSRDVRYAALCFAVDAAKDDKPAGFAQKLYEQLPTSFAKDDDSRVAFSAAKLLRTRQPELVSKFLERVEAATDKCEDKLLKDAANDEFDAGTRADAIDALSLLPSQKRDELLARFLNPDQGERARIRRAAAGVLALSDTPTAIEALRAAMQDEDSVVKLVAAQALGRRGNLDAVKYLVDLLSHREAKIRAPAADALGTLGAKALPALVGHLNTSLDKADKLAKWQVPLRKLKRQHKLASEEEDEIERLEKAIEDYKSKEPRRNEKHIAWGILSGLGRIAAEIGPQAAPALDAVVRAARCHDLDVRRAATNALADFRAPKAVETLATRLKDPDETVRWYATTALEKHGDAAIPALTAALDDPEVAATAATSLARVGKAASIEPLIARLKSAKAATRAAFVWSIGELLKRHPLTPQAKAARDALTAESQRTDEPEAARLARYALARDSEKTHPPK